jgi:hypothetical protein
MLKYCFILIFTVFVSVSAYADSLHISVPLKKDFAPKCYSPVEAEAEQGIRIHSELMVIGLNCQHMTPRGWTNFYAQYRDITKKHASLISGYENTLIQYFRKTGERNPEGQFNDLRTDLANKVSVDAAQMRPDVFCATFAPRIPKVAQMSHNEFKNWASNVHTTTRPMCR